MKKIPALLLLTFTCLQQVTVCAQVIVPSNRPNATQQAMISRGGPAIHL